MAFADMLQHTMDVYGVVTADDNSAGQVLTYSSKAAGVPCLSNTLSSSEREKFQQLGLSATHKLATLYDGAVQGDKVVVTGHGAFEVVGIQKQLGVGTIGGFVYLTVNQMQGQ